MALVGTATLMDGTALAARVNAATALRASALVERTGVAPCLATVLVGSDPASAAYVRMKQKRCAAFGLASRHVSLPADTTTSSLVSVLSQLSADPAVHGILLQHPVPVGVDERAAFEAIAPAKDVDGVTLRSFAGVSYGLPGFASCTPLGIMRLLDEYGVKLPGQRVVVVGRGPILGKPLGMMLLARDATVTFCHSRTVDLPEHTRAADVLVAAVGRPELIRGGWIKPGAVVIDAGYNDANVGDVEFVAASRRAGLITPVPGGVGPMTIAMLLEQTVQAAELAL